MNTRRSASYWAGTLGITVELLALLALAGTLEISFHPFAFAALALLVSTLLRKTIPERWLVGAFAVVFVGALAYWRLSHAHPLLVVSHAAPVAHGLLWFAGKSNRYRGWRLGLGMIELVLASVLTAEAYLPLAIIVFVILGSTALACNFLDHELHVRAPEFRDNPLPRSFIPSTIGLSVVLFLTALVIFPILPRTQGTINLFGDGLRMGYNEGVNISRWRTFTSTSTGSTVMRLFPPEGVDLTMEIYLGLLRGRVLDNFDGKNWSPGVKRQVNSRVPADSKPTYHPAQAIQIDVIREAIHSDILPTPYGTRELTGGRKLETGEWIEPRSWESRINYSFTLVPNDLTYLKNLAATDPVLPVHTRLPKEVDTERLRRESKTIFGNAKSVQEKVIKIMTYYQDKGFAVAASPSAEDDLFSSLPKGKYHPIEEFLFFRKRGHCEWYSSATAILLRMAGVPTRLIAGFRVNKSQMTGILSVHDADGHAWLEAYSPERGWIPLDPTPRLTMPGSMSDMFREGYDWVSAYWYRYVIAYTAVDFKMISKKLFGKDGVTEGLKKGWEPVSLLSTLREQKSVLFGTMIGLLAIAAAAAVALRLWFPWVFSIRWRVNEGPAPLRRERLRVEKLLKRRAIREGAAGLVQRDRLLLEVYRDKGTAAGDALRDWFVAYDEARFGRTALQSNDAVEPVRLIRERYQKLSKLVASVSALLFSAGLVGAATPALASESLQGNSLVITSPPAWLTLRKAEKVSARIESKLQWDIRKIQVRFYTDSAAFKRAHGYSSPTMTVMAFTLPSDQSVHLGPAVSADNFERIFGHELVHVILIQKYKNAVPKWLEEGLANFMAEKGRPNIDYAWLKNQIPRDIRSLNHPFKGAPSAPGIDAKFHYMASTAMIAMLSTKCDLEDLLSLSVGKNLENYLPTYCSVPDINAEFRNWLQSRR